MTKPSTARLARRQHATEAFIAHMCSGCGRIFILRGRVTPVAECASEDEANSHVQKLATEYRKREPSSPVLAIMTEEDFDAERPGPDDDAPLH